MSHDFVVKWYLSLANASVFLVQRRNHLLLALVLQLIKTTMHMKRKEHNSNEDVIGRTIRVIFLTIGEKLE